MPEPVPENPYVSRGGLKLAAALDAFDLDVKGYRCVDLGCNVGGFTDALLQRGASHVIAIDTGYGELAWKLRNDDRVTVAERTNAMHCDINEITQRAGLQILLPKVGERPGEGDDARDETAGNISPSSQPSPLKREGVPLIDLAVIDMGWTRQKHAIPAALRWQPRQIISLIKPHYECEEKLPRGAVLNEQQAQSICDRVIAAMPELGVRVIGTIISPIRGGKGKGKKGNVEYLALLEV